MSRLTRLILKNMSAVWCIPWFIYVCIRYNIHIIKMYCIDQHRDFQGGFHLGKITLFGRHFYRHLIYIYRVCPTCVIHIAVLDNVLNFKFYYISIHSIILKLISADNKIFLKIFHFACESDRALLR